MQKKTINILLLLLLILLPLGGGFLGDDIFRMQWTVVGCSVVVVPLLVLAIIARIKNTARVGINITDLLLRGYVVWAMVHALLISPVRNDPAFFLEGCLLVAAYTIARLVDVKKSLLWGVLISGGVQAAIACVQVARVLSLDKEYFWATGSFFSSALLAELTAIAFLSGVWLCRQPRRNYVVIALTILNLVGLMASNSRAAWVATLVGVVVLFADRVWIKRRWVKMGGITGLFIVVLVGAYMLRPVSANGRLLVWRVMGNVIAQAPVVGNGAESFRAKYLLAQADYLAQNPETAFAENAGPVIYPFNEFLAVICRYGIIGLLLLAGWIFAILRGMSDTGFRAVMSVLLVFSIFSYTTESLTLMLILMFVAGGSRSKTVFNMPIRGLYSLIILIAGIVYLAVASYRFYMPYRQGVINRQIMTNGDFIMSNENVQCLRILDARSRISMINKQMTIAPNVRIVRLLSDSYAELNDTNRAISYARLNCRLVPNLLKPKEHLMTLYQRYDRGDSARMVANEILRNRIKVHNAEADSIIVNAQKTIAQ